MVEIVTIIGDLFVVINNVYIIETEQNIVIDTYHDSRRVSFRTRSNI